MELLVSMYSRKTKNGQTSELVVSAPAKDDAKAIKKRRPQKRLGRIRLSISSI